MSDESTNPVKQALGKLWSRFIRLFTSFGLTTVLLLTLLLLTWLGTLYQVDNGLLKAQRKYFESWFLLHEAGSLKIPLPGAHLVLWIFALNMLIGGLVRVIIRISKGVPVVGILIGHLGIVLLVSAGAVKIWFSDDGLMRLAEGESGAEFQSSIDWEIAIWKAPDGSEPALQHVIDGSEFYDVELGDWRRFTHEALPFELYIEGYMESSVPEPATPDRSGKEIDGFVLTPKKWHTEDEKIRNVGGVYAMIREKGGRENPAILWGLELHPWTTTIGGESWQVRMRPKTWDLPFTVKLIDAHRKDHPGTSMAAEYSSDIEWYEDGSPNKHHIEMNAPLRRNGYTLFQTGYEDVKNPDTGAITTYSTFSVVRNPSDYWPELACWIIAAGLLIHFLSKVSRYVVSQIRRRSA